MLATIVETKELLRTVIASLAAGVGVTAVFSIMIVGASRLADMRRNERSLAAAVYGALTALAFAVTVASIVFGIIVMTQKS